MRFLWTRCCQGLDSNVTRHPHERVKTSSRTCRDKNIKATMIKP